MGVVALSLVLVALVLLYRYLQKLYSVFERINLPGPKPKWVIGNLKEFKDRNPLEVFKEFRKKYGKIYGFFEGFRPSIVVNDPEMTKEILVKHFDKFGVRPVYNPFTYYPDHLNLFTTSGSLWKQQRSIVATAFNKINMEKAVENVKVTSDIFLAKLAKLVEYHPEGFNIATLLDGFTLDAFALSAFNYEVNSMDDPDAILMQFMTETLNAASTENKLAGICRVYESLTPILKIFDYKHRRVHMKHVEKMRQMVQLTRQQKNYTTESTDNLLDHIITRTFSSRDEEGKVVRRALDDEEIIAHLHSLIGGGLGTLNAALEFVVHCLAMNQPEQQRAYDEIFAQCGLNEHPTVAALKNMEYLEMVMNEALRLYPCAPGTARMCTQDCTINGVEFKAGMMIRVMAFTLYEDEEYFPQPKKFMPERFNTAAKKERHPYTFIPFGQGPRICVGMKFGIYLIKIALVKILQKYVIVPSSKTQDPLPTVLRPMLAPRHGVFIKLVPRRTGPPVISQG
ncbi:cytochrome P450 3A28-like [Mizuhopecten yessoensis]|uniref:cytochrome P450 3A28-like n=1 Tax=Mizuhopecten yessoensis TaxID=6573 RepID=UPI000B45BE94|nr:cytochrome P450 3A28-like [Mizuhopecten yessoensis]XP_021345681.1 cytochrome P450 3A28-like [Mizuhopecten yessoensis]XP_021345682.1 cytochrome P450 3A28-like [Mizuhopecten yessoensis]XP_021345683.1 cytochrome P450 3A28-like [Mizuhopecten yessoensis]XP_021345684.1 cytochrome P450 3A28-like [Mizuhopecten yessoensis]XP_021345685.1 cytochrome P450 3A28-like [Mizuhopecten yessoensis]